MNPTALHNCHFFPNIANQTKTGDWISLFLMSVTRKRFSERPFKHVYDIGKEARNNFIIERYLMTSLF
jgi:hypothetical protein